MNIKKYKVVVAHPYKQHSFEMAEALRKKEILFKYITTVYYKKYNFTWVLGQLCSGSMKQKILSRQDKRIDSFVKQYCEILGLLKLLTLKIKSLNKYYIGLKYKSSDIFSGKVAEYCMKNNVDAVVLYDDTSPKCSEMIKKKKSEIKVILDMSAPGLPFLSDIYEKDMIISPQYAEQLRNERKNALDPKLIKRSKREIEAADYFIVASNFSAKSILKCGKKKENIYICPYGVDSQLFKPGQDRNHEVLNAVYIGGTKQFKGISYLLEAFEILKEKPVKLTIVGINTFNEDTCAKYKNIEFTGIVMPEKVAEILKKSDFMIFPSIGDGFGLSVTEALSAGCPVICSTNTGAVDLIENGFNGFQIPPHDADSIVKYVNYFLDNRSILRIMQENARDSVKEYTWDRYYKLVGAAIESIKAK